MAHARIFLLLHRFHRDALGSHWVPALCWGLELQQGNKHKASAFVGLTCWGNIKNFHYDI